MTENKANKPFWLLEFSLFEMELKAKEGGRKKKRLQGQEEEEEKEEEEGGAEWS